MRSIQTVTLFFSKFAKNCFCIPSLHANAKLYQFNHSKFVQISTNASRPHNKESTLQVIEHHKKQIHSTQPSFAMRLRSLLGDQRGKGVDDGREQIRSAGANLAGFHPVTKGDNRASKKERKTRSLQSNDTPPDEQESNCQLA